MWKRRFIPGLSGIIICCGCIVAPSCRSPLQREGVDQLQRSVRESIQRELEETPQDPALLETTQPPGDVAAELSQRREELELIGPRVYDEAQMEFGVDLASQPQEQIELSLQSAVEKAVKHNLGVQIAKLQPAINEADVVAASAAFDAVFFSNVDLTYTDQPTTVPVLNGVPLGTPFDAGDRYRFETGVRRLTSSGGEITVSTDLTRFRNDAPGIGFSPDPAYTAALRLGLTQPLLRGFGSEVNRARIYLNQNAERRAVEQLRIDLLELAANVEAAYWRLVIARAELAIRQWLIDEGTDVRETLGARRDFDARPAQYSDAVATVEQRKADLIAARRAVREASDDLKVLINDPEVTIGSEAVLKPVDTMVEAPIRYNLREAVATAIKSRPEIAQALLDIDDTAISVTVAENRRLPLLNLVGELAYFGLSDDAEGAYEESLDDDFIDYVLGLRFEQPVGNRAAEAEVRQARLQRSAATIAYRRAIQQVIQDVKTTLRDVVTNYKLIQASRSFRIAQAENLRTLSVQTEFTTGLTPEVLDLTFTRQEVLAQAKLQEVQALADYNTAVADLYRAMGVGLAMNRIEFVVDRPE